jgi:hypothetical protein
LLPNRGGKLTGTSAEYRRYSPVLLRLFKKIHSNIDEMKDVAVYRGAGCPVLIAEILMRLSGDSALANRAHAEKDSVRIACRKQKQGARPQLDRSVRAIAG